MRISIIVSLLKKLKLEQEIKLREFNFKMLLGVLPCNRNSNSLSLPVSGLHEKRSVIPPALVPIPAGRMDALEKSETKSSKNS